MKRRTFIAGVGAGVTATAGCLGYQQEPGDGVVTVATYDSFVDGEEPVGPWLKERFEAQRDDDVTIEFQVPEAGVNQYIQRAKQDAPIEADLYVGLNVDELIRIDDELDSALFDSLSGQLERSDRVLDELRFDPDGRAVPYDTGYISLVYDEEEVEPETFEDLTAERNRGDLIVQNAQQSDPGRAFLLWTIHEFGADGYLDYWQDLQDNDVRVLGSWDDAYNAYLEEEAPMVVSYSTDQVYYGDTPRHQVGFLNDQGYANPEGMARFADADDPDATVDLMEFMLTPEAQGEIAQRNVQFPAVDDAELDEEFSQFAHVPPEPVTFSYDELAGNLDGWVEDWARQVAQ
ncbi:thiamine ABC transporter substrate-binding protein [Natronomonas halophila]|uniref:thiamine ABC transporter substrate-binding protein n=1 Tax=Natronomonas halophila TaxID=2747817 RepID=UPI0015B3CEE1|nr:thiamine ABC transporter substrate-binding protein [Natronomonas halophila]QLD85798.1 thiamine ABC transporter substrate-binding protein [Natronomonas halophila]